MDVASTATFYVKLPLRFNVSVRNNYMRLIIDIGHPAHVHLFKYVAMSFIERKQAVIFTFRERQHVSDLLEYYGFEKYSFGSSYTSVIGKLIGLFIFDYKMVLRSIKFKPTLFLSHGSIYAAHASFLINVPHVSLQDTFNMEQLRLSLPFTDTILTGDYVHYKLGKKELTYPGYHELAYLHPNVFNPDIKVVQKLNLKNNENYAIIRFVAWNASHDIGNKGLLLDNKIRLVLSLEKHLRVFISSEGKLPHSMLKYQISINPEDMHSALYYAHLFVGESPTMASEAACLGTPAVYINDSQLGYTNELANRYGLVYCYTGSESDQLDAINKAISLARDIEIKTHLLPIRDKLLQDKVDVSSFLVWFIDNYPKSINEVKYKTIDFRRFK